MAKAKNRLSGVGLIAPDKDKHLSPAEEGAVLTFLSAQFGFITNLQALKPQKTIAVGNYPYEVAPVHYALMQEMHNSIRILAQTKKKTAVFYLRAAVNLLYLRFLQEENAEGKKLISIVRAVNKTSDNRIAVPSFIWNALLFYTFQPKGEDHENQKGYSGSGGKSAR